MPTDAPDDPSARSPKTNAWRSRLRQVPPTAWIGLAAALAVALAMAALVRADHGAEERSALRSQVQTLRQALTALRDAAAAQQAGLQSALEAKRARLDALSGQVETLANRLQALQDEAAPQTTAQPTAQPPGQPPGNNPRLAGLEHASFEALATLDQQVQSIGGHIEALQSRDAALAQALEDTRIALDAELAQWRDRQTPPLVALANRLAGKTVQFSEGNRLADPTAAERLIGQVGAWLLEAGPEIGIRVTGYADIDGSGEPSNRIASQKRAEAVRDAMIRLGLPADRLVAVGRSTENRLVDDDSAGNANRRVAFEPFYLPSSP